MSDYVSPSFVRRAEPLVGLLLVAVSFAPWWTYQSTGSTASAWTGPHFVWLAVLLCVAIVVGRALAWPVVAGWWAPAGIVIAIGIAGWGLLAELTASDDPFGDGKQLAWVLEPQNVERGTLGGPFDPAWGLTAGVLLMVLLLVGVSVAARLRRDH